MASRLFRTTTFRLSLLFLLLVSAAAAVTVAYIYWNTTVLLGRQLEETIEAEIRGLAEQYRSGGLVRLVATIDARSQTPGNSLYLVSDPQGRRIAGNLRSAAPELWNTVGRVEFIYSRPAPGGTENRLALANVFRLAGGFRLIVGRDIEDRRAFNRFTRAAMLWGLGLMIIVGLGGGWLISRHLLSRIEAVNETSRTIMAGDLTGRIPVTGSDDELDRLSHNLNQMLDRIEQLMTGLREVSDNIAHDLKTPLTRMRNRVEAALRGEGGEGAYREALERTIEDADELMRTFNALLSIARLEAAAAAQDTMAEVEVGALVRDVAELYEPVAEESGLRLELSVDDTVRVHGDRQLLGQAVANLLDNAIKYGSDGVPGAGPDVKPAITLAVAGAGDRAEIVVADRGPGIPEHERERVLKRFVRLEVSRSRSGSGLGLSLVAAVTRLHGGYVRLEDNAPGLRAVLSLPAMRSGDGQGGARAA